MRRFGSVRSVSVWLVLLGFFCGMLVPAVSVAKVHREIETEGDPGDGMDVEGRGSNSGWVADQGTKSNTSLPMFDLMDVKLTIVVVNGKLTVQLKFHSAERKK